MKKDWIDILACPENKTSVKEAEMQIIQNINEQIEKGLLKNRKGEVVSEIIEGGLVREDGKYLYPIRNGIPVMLIDESIEIENMTQ